MENEAGGATVRHPTGAAPRTVIIDDVEEIRVFLRVVLERAGHEVVGDAGDGRAGIEVVRAQRPDVVLLDLSMPVMDGLEALPQITAAVPDAVVIVFSGFEAHQMRGKAVELGAHAYVEKGGSTAEFVEQVRAAMQRDR